MNNGFVIIYINKHFFGQFQCMSFEPFLGICNLTHKDPFVLFISDCVNMIHHVYTFLAFFDDLGFVDVKALAKG
jgi:hypothetical protein